MKNIRYKCVHDKLNSNALLANSYLDILSIWNVQPKQSNSMLWFISLIWVKSLVCQILAGFNLRNIRNIYRRCCRYWVYFTFLGILCTRSNFEQLSIASIAVTPAKLGTELIFICSDSISLMNITSTSKYWKYFCILCSIKAILNS